MLETLLALMRDGKTIGPLPKNPLRLALIGSRCQALGLPNRDTDAGKEGVM
jgi:hypothetical protein